MSFRFLENIFSQQRKTESISLQENNARSLIRELIDPENTLPPVIVLAPNQQNYRQIVLEGRVIGEAVVEGLFTKYFSRIQLHGRREDRLRGTGLATYLYVIEEAIKNGNSFKSDTQVSNDAKRIWEILKDRGVAEVRSEFVEYEVGKFRGDYRVRANSWK